MTPQQERAARVLAYLEARTTANGCTPAETEAARTKAEEIRARYGLDQTPRADDLDIISAQERARVVSEYLDQLAALVLELSAHRKRRPRAVRYRWGIRYRR